MNNVSGPDGTITGSGVPTEEATAEAKRLAARRRFLIGGASALPLIVTLGTKEAWAASMAVCHSMGINEPIKNYNSDGLTASLYCDP